MAGSTGKRPATAQLVARRREIGRERREQTRQRLLMAAAQLVASRGTESLTIDDFVRAAGIARGTFYNYFRTRDEIIAALWRHFGKGPLHFFKTTHEDDPDPAYRLTSGLRMTVAKAASDPVWGWLFLRITAEGAAVNEELRAFPKFDIEAGVRSGRFRALNVEVACDYFVGVALTSLRTVLNAERPLDYGEQCAALVLAGLGLDAADAQAVSERALPAAWLDGEGEAAHGDSDLWPV